MPMYLTRDGVEKVKEDHPPGTTGEYPVVTGEGIEVQRVTLTDTYLTYPSGRERWDAVHCYAHTSAGERVKVSLTYQLLKETM